MGESNLYKIPCYETSILQHKVRLTHKHEVSEVTITQKYLCML